MPGLYSHNPVLSTSEDMIAIVWEEKEKKKNNTSLKICLGSDENSMRSRELISYNEVYNLQPDVLVVEDDTLVTYSGPDGEIYVLRGKEKGKFWYPPNRLTFTPSISLEPRFYYDKENKKIYVFYLEEEAGNYFLRYTSSLNFGATWQPSGTILNSEKSGIAIFFPSIFVSGNKFYVVYQGRVSIKQEIKSSDSIYFAIVNEKDAKVLKNEKLVSPQKEVQYTPVANKMNRNVIWQESEQNIWSIFTGILDEEKEVYPVKVNAENKNCYGHTAVFSKENGYVKIFWSMVDELYSQIYSRKYYYQENKLGNQELVVKTSHNSYSPFVSLYKNVEYIVWQEEYDANKSVIMLKRQDTTAAPPLITKPQKEQWYSSSDITVSWQPPADPSGTGGYGFLVSTRRQPDKVIQNLPPEVNSVSLKGLLVEGTNYFHVRFFDRAGNGSEVIIRPIKMDVSGPFIEMIASPTHPFEHFITNQLAVVDLKAVDDYQSVTGYTYQIDYGKEQPIKVRKVLSRGNRLRLKVQKGISYLKVSAVDSLGNWGPMAVYPFYISKREPVIAVVKEEPKLVVQAEKKKEEVKVQTNQPVKTAVVKEEPKLVVQAEKKKEEVKVQTNQPVKAAVVKEEPKPVVQVEKKVEKKIEPGIKVEESEREQVIREHLRGQKNIVSRRIYSAKTEDYIGKPDQIVTEEVEIRGVKFKRVRFRIYTTSTADNDSVPPQDKIFIWSPVLNYSEQRSETPWLPVFRITEGRLIKGEDKTFCYFHPDILVLPEQDFIIIFTLQGRQMQSSIVTLGKKADPNLIPHSLRWLLYAK
ncbi:MAG: hypothetical protein PHF84_04640 [bacterium]|nr:hypothetical protein [bacterium]